MSKYGKLNNDGYLMLSIKQVDNSWSSLNNFETDENGNYYEFCLEADDNGFYAKDEVKLQEKAEIGAIAHFKSLYLEIFNAKLKELDYDSIATIQLWMDDATFGVEATRIMTWYKAIITKNYMILNTAKASGIIPTDEEYLTEIATVIF